jgi:hypothetical protein
MEETSVVWIVERRLKIPADCKVLFTRPHAVASFGIGRTFSGFVWPNVTFCAIAALCSRRKWPPDGTPLGKLVWTA